MSFENKHMGGYHRIYPDNEKTVYCEILKKMSEKKPKKTHKKQDSIELKALESSEIYTKT